MPMSPLQKNQSVVLQAGLWSLAIFAFYALSASPAHAQTIGSILCGVWNLIYTDIGRGIATLAIVAVGIGATLGKASWGMAIMVAVGIAVMFGANTLVATLFGTSC